MSETRILFLLTTVLLYHVGLDSSMNFLIRRYGNKLMTQQLPYQHNESFVQQYFQVKNNYCYIDHSWQDIKFASKSTCHYVLIQHNSTHVTYSTCSRQMFHFHCITQSTPRSSASSRNNFQPAYSIQPNHSIHPIITFMQSPMNSNNKSFANDTFIQHIHHTKSPFSQQTQLRSKSTSPCFS
jgi:hypothetical protein